MSNSVETPRIPWEKWNIHPWLKSRTILLTKHGSHAYGLSRPESDVDVKGIAIPPMSYLHGYRKKFEQAETNEPVDCVIFGVQKFVKLAADCNPNIVEILFTDEEHWLHGTVQAQILRANRHLFLSTRARYTFSGYAFSQLKRLKGHHAWLVNPPTHQPTRAEYGLPDGPTLAKDHRETLEALVKSKLESWDIDWDLLADEAAVIEAKARLETALIEIGVASREDLWEKAARSIGVDTNVMEILAAERRYKAAQETWRQYTTWKAQRNKARFELEEKHGYDTKHAMHLVRLLRMAHEILATGQVIVKRPDRDELLAIRAGAWTYERLMEYATEMEQKLVPVYEASKLPREPDRQTIDNLCIELVESMA